MSDLEKRIERLEQRKEDDDDDELKVFIFVCPSGRDFTEAEKEVARADRILTKEQKLGHLPLAISTVMDILQNGLTI